jgi:hypothetical protein
MRQDGLQRMLDFLDKLEGKGIEYFITRYSPEGLTVTLTLVGVRVEAEFTVDKMQFSYFKGTEDVITDEKILDELIEENWGDE